MTERRPSPADDDSDFLWQSTCGSDISPCLAEPDHAPAARRESDPSFPRGDSLDEEDDAEPFESFGLDGVELPSASGEAHAIVGRRARWRGSEIYSGPLPSVDLPATPFAESPSVAAPGAPLVPPVVPPVVPLVGTMLAAAVAFVGIMTLPGWFGLPAASPLNPAAMSPATELPSSPAIPPSTESPPSQAIAPPAVERPAAVVPQPEAGPKSTPPPLPAAPLEQPATSTDPPAVAPAPPAKPPTPAAPVAPAPHVPLPAPQAAPERPASIPVEVSRLAPHLAEQKLSIARQLEAAGKLAAAQRRYEELLRDYPNTNVSDEAAARLKNLRALIKD